MAPNQITPDNSDLVFKNLYPENWDIYVAKEEKPKFAVGDPVRITKEPFQKSYLATWSEQIYTIEAVIGGKPIVYSIVDYKNEPIAGTFYAEKLQQVKPPEVYRIDEIIDEGINKKGERELLVQWQGYKEQSWIPATDTVENTSEEEIRPAEKKKRKKPRKRKQRR